MEYTYLGRTGLSVSRLCLGTMNFGPQTEEKEGFRIMDRALDVGINFFDTADVYGQHTGKGNTETILGRWFAQGGGRREKVALATKFFGAMEDWPNKSKVSAAYMRYACEASLKRLQTDHIELYQMHHIFRHAPWEETWQAYEQLTREGKIVYAGSSNFAGWHTAQANEAARRRNYLGLVSEQSIYHLNNRWIELDVLPACEAYGLGVLPWSPLGGGLLGGILKRENEGRRASAAVQSRLEKERPKIEKYEALCESIGVRPADVALAWLVRDKRVTAPIIGPRTVDQLDEAVRALEANLSEETLKALDEIFPAPGVTPGKPSPEAYAW